MKQVRDISGRSDAHFDFRFSLLFLLLLLLLLPNPVVGKSVGKSKFPPLSRLLLSLSLSWCNGFVFFLTGKQWIGRLSFAFSR